MRGEHGEIGHRDTRVDKGFDVDHGERRHNELTIHAIEHSAVARNSVRKVFQLERTLKTRRKEATCARNVLEFLDCYQKSENENFTKRSDNGGKRSENERMEHNWPRLHCFPVHAKERQQFVDLRWNSNFGDIENRIASTGLRSRPGQVTYEQKASVAHNVWPICVARLTINRLAGTQTGRSERETTKREQPTPALKCRRQ